MKSWRYRLSGAEFKVMSLQDSGTLPLTPPVLDTPENVVGYLRGQLAESIRYNPDTENLIAILVSVRRRPIGFEVISTGTLDTIMVHPREVFRHAVILGAAAVILAHNHPSGDPCPSDADVKVTRDLIRAGQLLKIYLLDHIILGRATVEASKDWTSLRELGYFYS